MRWQGVLGAHHPVERVANAVGVERRPAAEQRVHEAAKRPDIGLEAVGGARRDLGRDEVWRAAHGEVLLVRLVQLGGQAEVADLHVHVLGEQQVGEGEVAVQDAVRVQVEHAVHHLLQVVARFVLAQARPIVIMAAGGGGSGFQVAAHLALVAQLEHQVHVVLVLEERVQLQDRGMLQLVVDLHLVLHALRHLRRLHLLLVDLRGQKKREGLK